MKKTVGIFAHVDAGKTTLAEAILYITGVTRRKGSIEGKNTVMGTSAIERERGITCFSDAAGFSFGGNEFYLIDTPGHADFLPDTERCMASLDCAVLVLSVVDGIESNTELLWSLLRACGVPIVFFINKCDRDIANPETVLADIRHRFCEQSFLYHSEEYIEAAAASDDSLMEAYFAGELDALTCDEGASRLFMQGEIFPCVCGSALTGDGVEMLLECIDTLCRPEYDCSAPLVAEIFKVRREKDRRIIFAHMRSGSLAVRGTLPNGEIVSELRLCNGVKPVPVQMCKAGDVIEICGVYNYKAGDRIGGDPIDTQCRPALISRVIYPEKIGSADMMAKLRILEDEEPSLAVTYEGHTSEISVSVMGTIQLEILKFRIAERFGIDAEFGKCDVLYKETVEKTTVGYGHFEPLRHYSEVHLRIDPAPRGSGISFASECSTDVLTSNYQNLVRTHVFEKIHKGVLCGVPLDDVKITLLTGRSHEKHTEGGDFREATYRAIRHALMRSSSVLLEPWYNCSFAVSAKDSGRVISDVTRMSGRLLSSDTQGEQSFITAHIPVSEMTEYQTEFASFTRGKGRLIQRFDGYDVCHDAAAVIERKGYEPERDTENTADSVFCSHGAGHVVNWREVEDYIHCK